MAEKKPDTTINWADQRMPQLQVALTLERDWIEDAACLNQPQEVKDWFFTFGRGDEFRAACAICSVCSVKSLCYSYAVVYGERGVWGGTNQSERDEKRPFIVDEIVELWPHLYEKWQGRHEREQAEIAEAQDLDVPALPVPEDATEEHARARARASDGMNLASWAHGRRNPRQAAEIRNAE